MIPKSSAKLRLKSLGLRSMSSGSAERKGRQCQVQVLQSIHPAFVRQTFAAVRMKGGR